MIVDHGRALARPVRRVQDEAAPLLHGATVMDADVAAAGRHRQAERLQGLLEGDLAHGEVDHQPERALGAMPHDVDDGPGEPRIAERIGRHEQAAGQRAAGRRLGAPVRRRRHDEQRGEEERGHRRTTS